MELHWTPELTQQLSGFKSQYESKENPCKIYYIDIKTKKQTDGPGEYNYIGHFDITLQLLGFKFQKANRKPMSK